MMKREKEEKMAVSEENIIDEMQNVDIEDLKDDEYIEE